jgi:3'-phosphoadenosine 5'-phosphosulfate sulfotransferase (PAPS reductase)/FAD synthetase
VSISGGSDSDIVMDLFERIGYDEGLVTYIWFDTGLEYAVTKRHLTYLEERYGVTIQRMRAEKTVAWAVKECGVPFLGKMVSQKIKECQKHGVVFTDEPYEVLMERYPRTKSGLAWFCGQKDKRYSAYANAGLRDFLIQRDAPKISEECCKWAKKKTARAAEKELGATLGVVGVRRAEGGVRSVSYKSCFSESTERRISQFRPIFYFTDADKQEYEAFCGIKHSDCYEVYGMRRTGCVGCPFNSKFEEELKILERYEPNLYKAAVKIFGPSYEYTMAYRKFKEEWKKERRKRGKQDKNEGGNADERSEGAASD